MKEPQITNTEILSDEWSPLKRITCTYSAPDGKEHTITHEVYERGDAATVLLFNKEQKTILLTRQFRLVTFLNGNKTGFLLETCAGMLDKDTPEDCIRREIMEELGYEVNDIKKLFTAYMSPGAMPQLVHFFSAPYTPDMKKAKGGGLEEEGESIEILELPFDKVSQLLEAGDIKDAKTIMLLQYAQLHNIFEP